MTEPLRIGIAGLGTVGAAVAARLITTRADFTLRAGRDLVLAGVAARDRSRDRGFDLAGIAWFEDPVALASSTDIDIFIELIGGDEGAARAAVEAALQTGKSVVTANKALLAKHGAALSALAEKKGVALAFEASAAGGIPIVKVLREAMSGNRLSRVYGIMNGTCNYILTRMEKEKLSFEECLADAQRLGYAEADPTFDIGGFDTAHKLAILTSLAFGTEIDAEAVYVEGIGSLTLLDLAMADELGYRIKLLGVATRTQSGIEQRVHPTMVPKSSAIARVKGVTNAVALDGDMVGEITLVGPGAGGNATASAVLADIVDVARGVSRPPFGIATEHLVPASRAPMTLHAGGYYIRLMVQDRPGAAAAIATRMAEKMISLESILQRGGTTYGFESPEGTVPVVLITHATTETAVRQVLDAVVADGHVIGEPQMIRIEKEQ
ncbi:homoserine dehydrogenase [Agaricicola taiwanensis]|nr:homoserine dehydrogenase [Agaricicola taiwanensis]